MLFVANFRHEPNKEAIEYLCAEVLPLIDRSLLERHPVRVIGNRLAEARLDIDERTPGVQLVGWVPEITPYLEQSRISVVPLLHGAGVKGKVLQSMMAYTPVVTTPVGAEGLEIVNGVHALVGTDAADLAAGITRLLVDDELWTRVADAGADHMDARHSLELVRTRFTDVVAQVMQRPARTHGGNRGGMTVAASDGRADAIRRRVQMIAAPGAVVLVATAGESIELRGQRDVAFVEPPDGPTGIARLEAQREQGAAYLVLPKPAFAWRHTLPELHHHLEETTRRVHQDEHMIVYDLASRDADPILGAADTRPRRVHVLGTYAPDRTGPAGAVVAELANSRHDVHQTWRSATEPPPALDASDVDAADADFPDPDYLVYVRDDAILPSRFVDDLVATQAHLDADRVQPTHISGPASGPPIIERHKGVIAREVLRPTPLPVLSVRAGADPDGPVALLDRVNVGLRAPVHATEDAIDAFSHVCTVWVRGTDGSIVRYDRPEPEGVPRISVVMATYERGDLLRESLLAFSKQTLNRSEYEVVLVDDGSRDSSLDAMLDEFAEQLQVTGVRIEHAGRSAAKNMAILLARAPVVLIFDDDDRPAPDYLERHVRAHDARPEPGVAILGHTDWAPEVEPTEVMHFVTDVDRLMFAYERLRHGQELDWRGFWEGRISCKRAHLVRHALHDQRINYSIDVEMGWRLAPHGLRVIYDTTAVSVMARPLDTETFCTRIQAKGRAHAAIAALHPGTDIARQFNIDAALELWEKQRSRQGELRRRVASLEARAGRDEREAADARDQKVISELHVAYRQLFKLLHAKGVAEATGRLDRERVVAEPARSGPAGGSPAITPKRPRPPTTVPRVDRSPPEFAYDGVAGRRLGHAGTQHQHPGVEPQPRARRDGGADDRPDLGGCPRPDRGRRRRQRFAPRDPAGSQGVPLSGEHRRVGRLEHRHPLVGRRCVRRAQQRLHGRTRLGRSALRGGHRRPPHRVPVHRPRRRQRLHDARPGRHRGLVLHDDARGPRRDRRLRRVVQPGLRRGHGLLAPGLAARHRAHTGARGTGRARSPHHRRQGLAERVAAPGAPVQVRLEARCRAVTGTAVLQTGDRRVPRFVRGPRR